MEDQSLSSREIFFNKNFQYAGNGGGGGNSGGGSDGKSERDDRGKRIPKVLGRTLMKVCKFDTNYPGRLICTNQRYIKHTNQQRQINDSNMDFDRIYWKTYDEERERLNKGIINF